MAPRKKKKTLHQMPDTDADGMFRRMIFYLVPHAIQPRRLQIWKQKLLQMGATLENNLSNRITHILALDSGSLLHEFGHETLKLFDGKVLKFDWLERSLELGELISYNTFILGFELERENESERDLDVIDSQQTNKGYHNEFKSACFFDSHQNTSTFKQKNDQMNITSTAHHEGATISAEQGQSDSIFFAGLGKPVSDAHDSSDEISLLYNPPNLNQNITEIFGKLIDIYRALGDDRRKFSYHKAIHVIEKLPFKIESVNQVKEVPAIGKSLQDHIHEILTTGKLSKLDYFETDIRVRTITLFGEVWGIGPATALKLYEKGHRTLSDLEKEDSLSTPQRLGLKYFKDIKKMIPRDEIKVMEELLQKACEIILPGVMVTCGGSYRRGKAFCGDLDVVITHPDGQSHKGLLPKYIQYLKDIKFLREDLVLSIHSNNEGTDAGVDTYFGLCTFPGREQRYRIDLKVYPREIYAFGLVAWTGNDVLNRRYVMGRSLNNIYRRPSADSAGWLELLDTGGMYDNIFKCNANYWFVWNSAGGNFTYKNAWNSIRVKGSEDIMAKGIWASGIIRHDMMLWRTRWRKVLLKKKVEVWNTFSFAILNFYELKYNLNELWIKILLDPT